MASSNKLKHRSRRVAMKRKRKQRALIVIGVTAFAVVFGGSYSALKNYVGKVKDDVICKPLRPCIRAKNPARTLWVLAG